MSLTSAGPFFKGCEPASAGHSARTDCENSRLFIAYNYRRLLRLALKASLFVTAQRQLKPLGRITRKPRMCQPSWAHCFQIHMSPRIRAEEYKRTRSRVEEG